jgi:hypothetical protein
MRETNTMTGTLSWEEHGIYSFNRLSQQLQELLEPYKIAGHDLRVGEDASP